MALPAGVARLGSFKGNKGDRGPVGSIDFAEAVAVAADAPARATMLGTPDRRGVRFEVPRGLPGVDAIPAAEAVGEYLAAKGSPARIALDAAVAEIVDTRAMRFDIRDFGAVCDGQTTTVTATADSAIIERASGTWSSSDVGKRIAVRGAGPITITPITSTINAYGNDGVWIATIIAVSDLGATATLDSVATSTVTGADCVYGTPDDAAVSAAQDAAVNVGGGEVFFPGGVLTIVTEALTVKNFVTWGGAGKEVSHVQIIRDGLRWLAAPGTILDGITIHDFAIHAWSFVRSAGYGAAIKPLDINNQRRGFIYRMAIYDSPATAIPFDHGYDMSVIAENLIVRPGRLGGHAWGPGSSGIGLGTVGGNRIEPCYVVGNTIIGDHTATTPGHGNNGIFLEQQSPGHVGAESTGYRILGNIVVGMPIGIADDGSRATIIANNTIIGCGQNLSLNIAGVGGGHPGRDTLISGNAFLDARGPGDWDGYGVRISTWAPTISGRPDMTPAIRSMLRDNVITGNAKNGILLEVVHADMDGITIRGNSIRDNGRSGIRIRAGAGNSKSRMRHLAITGNQISGNGTAGVHGDDYGIRGTLNLIRSRVQDNDLYDQRGGIHLTAPSNILDVLNKDNLIDAPEVLADAASVAAGAMAGQTLPDGTYTTQAWSIIGAGAWGYTGTGMKPTSGTGRALALVNPSAVVSGAQYGAVSARIVALAPTSKFIGLAARASDAANYLHLVVHQVSGLYQLIARVGDVQQAPLWTGVELALLNDLMRLEVDETNIRVVINDVVKADIAAPATLAQLPGTWYGMLGNFSTDPTTTLDDFVWTTTYRR